MSWRIAEKPSTSDDTAMPETRIRIAERTDLPAMYELAQQSLALDSFSRELLAEKLFANPRPQDQAFTTLVAERDDRLIGFMQSVTRPAERKAWLGMFAVEADVRRQEVATQLFEHTRASWPEDTETVELLAIPGNYFTPGLDPRYTEALCFAERLGFERFKDCVNLTANLDHDFDTSGCATQFATEGMEIRRARPDDGHLLDAFFGDHFGPDWRTEAGLAMQNDPPALHLAIERGEIIAFSAHSTQNREWGFFGPMGTAPAARGRGIGRVLLWHCLNDLRAAGHRTAVIPWVGPISFYHRWAGCRVERVFWRYRLASKEQQHAES